MTEPNNQLKSTPLPPASTPKVEPNVKFVQMGVDTHSDVLALALITAALIQRTSPAALNKHAEKVEDANKYLVEIKRITKG